MKILFSKVGLPTLPPVLALALCSFLPGHAQDIVPLPASITPGAGTLTVAPTNRVVYTDASLQRLAEIHTDDIRRTHGVTLAAPAETTSPAVGDIVFALAGELSGEAYTLTVDGTNATVTAADYDGLAFAMMSLLQSASANGGNLEIPQMTVEDSPHRSYRAHQATTKVNGSVFSGNYYGMERLKKHVELCRFYKVRYFQIHASESQWMLATLDSSNTLSQTDLENLNLYSKAQWDDLIAYASERGVHLTPHNESTESFEGMKIALVDFGFTGIDWISELYSEEGITQEDGRDGEVDTIGNGADSADPDFDKVMELFTRRSYNQFAAGFPDGKLPYYHMGPVQGEGGTSPANMAKILSYLRLEDADVKLLFWGGPGPNDAVLQANKDGIVVDLYAPGQYHGTMQAHIDAGLTTINAAWRPNYITPTVQNSRRYIYDNANLFRMGTDGVLAPVQWSLASESDLVIGGLLPEWDFSFPDQGQFEAAIPRIPVWVDRLWNYTAFTSYTETDFDDSLPRLDAAATVANRFLADEEAPGLPTNLSASEGVYANEIRLVWTPSGNFPTGYDLYRGTESDSAAATIIASGIETPEYRDSAVTPGTPYFYWVKAVNAYGDSEFSNMATGSTGSSVVLPDVHEPFEYPSGQAINGQNGGRGMGGSAWSFGETVGDYTVVEGLTYSTLVSTGGALSIHPTEDGQGPDYVVSREVEGKIDVPGTQLWCSFLIRTKDGQGGDAAFGLNDRVNLARGFTAFDTVPGTLGLRMSNTGSGSYPMDFENGFTLPGFTYFIVMRLDFTSDNDRAFLWVNPGRSEPTPGEAVGMIDDVVSVGRADFNGFLFNPQGFGQGEFIIDELRLGAEYRAVAPGIATTPDPGEIEVTPASMAFGDEDLGVASEARTITIANTDGANDVLVSSIGVSGTNPADFLLSRTGGDVIAPGGEITFTVTFLPRGAGARSAELVIVSNDADEPTVTIPLSGNGLSTPPATPVNPVPADNIADVARNAILDWDDSPGAFSYDVFLWKDGETKPAFPTSSVGGSQFSPGIFTLNTTYFWQVSARNAAGVSEGEQWSFTTQEAGTPTVGWNYQRVEDGRLEELDLAGAPGFEQEYWNNHQGNGQGPGNLPLSNLINNAGAETTLDVTGWTVDSANSWSHFTTPTSNDSRLTHDFATKLPTITFSEVPYARYDVVVYYGNNEGPSPATITANGQSRAITCGNTDLSWFQEVGWIEGTDDNSGDPSNYTVFRGITGDSLTVAITSENLNIGIGFSAIQVIDAGDAGPAPASGPDPADFEEAVPLDEVLDWDDSEGADGYDIFVWPADGLEPFQPTGSVSVSEYTPTAPFDSVRSYRWRVVARDSITGTTTTGPVWNFTTLADGPPAVPVEPSPADGAVGILPIILLDWADAAKAASYAVRIWPASESRPDDPTALVVDSEYESEMVLAFSTEYVWEVEAINSVGSTVGDQWTFTTRDGVQDARKIGWNFVRTVSLDATEVAGVPGFAQENWNNHASNGQASGNVPFNDLVDNEGEATTLDVVEWTSDTNNSWAHTTKTATNSDERLMYDVATKLVSVTFDEVPFSAYDLVVYYGNNEGPSPVTLVVGDVSRTITSGNSSQVWVGDVGWLEGTDENGDTPSNYAIFSGLTSSRLAVSLTGDPNVGVGFSAIQFVEAANPVSGFFAWLENTPGAGSTFDANNDGDAWNDLVEYALGGDPATATPPPGLPVVDSSLGSTSLTFSRPFAISDVLYDIEGSVDWVNWFVIDDIFPTIQTEGETEILTFEGLENTTKLPGVDTSDLAIFRLRLTLR